MCGIAGIVAENRQLVAPALAAMNAALRHRGPDDSGDAVIELDGVALGLSHRRLSIIDLSPAGHQPMVHPRTGAQIIFNGEIYNFQTLRDELLAAGESFRGHSDTEVLLHALVRFGPEIIERLEGMYAFAYHDPAQRQLLLARDPLGIKPLYTAHAPGLFLFASEVRALVATGLVPRRLDRAALAGFLAYGSVPEPHTIFESVRAFPAGCWQRLALPDACRGRLPRPTRHWRFPALRADAVEPQAIEHVRGLLDAACRDHLVSDVPVGVFLSSGLDSTIMAALAARHTPHLRTFTVGFADNPDLSEGALGAETARLIGAEHNDIQITGGDAQAAALAWIDGMDQPSVDGLNTYVISKAVRERGIVVALSGLGGDELFGGYSTFGFVPRATRMMRRLAFVPSALRVAAAHVATIGKSAAVRHKAVDMAGSDGSVVELFLQCRRALSNDLLARLRAQELAGRDSRHFLPAAALADLNFNGGDAIAQISQLEATLYMGNTLLRDSDANGMAHSLEIRVPLLDRRLLDYVFALPGNVRLPDGRANKHLLRRGFADLLRPALLDQKKRGFTLPVGRWMMGPMRGLCEESLAHLKSLDLAPAAGIDDVWRSFVGSGDTTRWARAFTLCVLGLYARKMQVSAA